MRPAFRGATVIRGASRIWLLTASMAGLAIILAWHAMRLPALPAPVHVPWWVLAPLFYVVEVRVVHLQFQREAHSYSLSELPLVAGFFLVTPIDLILACVVGSSLGLLVHRRPAPIKLAFNVSLFAVSSAAAVSVFQLLLPAGDDARSAAAWLAAFAATLTAAIIGLAAVHVAIRLAQGRSDRRRQWLAVRFGLLVTITNTALGLVGMTLFTNEPGAAWLLLVPALLMALAWRSYHASMAESRQRDSLELLYEANSILHGTRDLEGAIVALLTEARRTFRAAYAELILFTAEGQSQGLRTILGPNDEVEMLTSVRLDPVLDSLRLEAIAQGAAFRAPRLPHGVARGDRVRGQVIHDAIVAPLRGERSLIGTFMMADRLGELGTFSADELRLFQTLADHAGVALENGRLGRSLKDLSDLKEQLRYQALHDDLTGLPNRTLFIERLEAAIGRRSREGNVPVVLFIDLDDFKAVNDSLGHAIGDELLKAVAAGIAGSIRPADVAARLAGDEFVVLVDDGRDIGAVIRIAERILASLARPVQLDGRMVSASASIGIAASRGRGHGSEELLHEADVAMYTAKTRGRGRFAVFDPSLESELTERQQLRNELSGVVGREELVLQYQPISDLLSGVLVGVEALVRWEHPTRGELAPADFIELAEETGAIVPIGRWVLRRACRQASQWADASGRTLPVSINISVGQLRQPDFVADVTAILRLTGLPPSCLTLEFAEAQVMADDPLIARRLHELKAVGVTLAIDGFGMGLSSLRSLGRFPFDVLKVARPLVAAMGRTAEDQRIAEAIVTMAHALDLQVVAEGIEDQGQLDGVRDIRCDRAQGFLLARPMDAPGILGLLGTRLGGTPLAA